MIARRTAVDPSGSNAPSRLTMWTQLPRSSRRRAARLLYAKMVIPGVGELIQFEDTEGNIACAMRYFDESKGRP